MCVHMSTLIKAGLHPYCPLFVVIIISTFLYSRNIHVNINYKCSLYIQLYMQLFIAKGSSIIDYQLSFDCPSTCRCSSFLASSSLFPAVLFPLYYIGCSRFGLCPACFLNVMAARSCLEKLIFSCLHILGRRIVYITGIELSLFVVCQLYFLNGLHPFQWLFSAVS